MKTVRLTSKHTVAQYEELRDRKGREEIADLIKLRMNERYVKPVLEVDGAHGFAIMAISCLLIETLGSFRNGWDKTNEKRDITCFEEFVTEAKLPIAGKDLFGRIRCGILHQGETYGWRIWKSGPAVNPDSCVIGVEKFKAAVIAALDRYHAELVASAWEDPIWKRAIIKLDAICKHCKAPPRPEAVRKSG